MPRKYQYGQKLSLTNCSLMLEIVGTHPAGQPIIQHLKDGDWYNVSINGANKLLSEGEIDLLIASQVKEMVKAEEKKPIPAEKPVKSVKEKKK